jgi:antitoxin VapB
MAALNIKNDEVVRLVKELADIEGKSMTAVVTEALREKLARERNPENEESQIQYWLDIGQKHRAAEPPESLDRDLTEDLYDDQGMPV